MFNLVILTGRLTANAELKTTPNGISVTSFCIAVDRQYKQGEERQADFINIVAWRGTAEFICKYFKKGNAIGIEGAIQTRKYTDRNGNNRVAFEVVANEVHFIESKKASNEESAPDPLNQFAEQHPEYVNVSDDDIPF